MRIGMGTCNGTFGELLQGVLNEQPFLVTFPMKSLKSEAVFIPDPALTNVVGSYQKSKAIKACNKLLELFQIKYGGTLRIDSNIPIGKGMASSTADIVAAVRAVAKSHRLEITEEIISSISINIEPTDGVMYENLVTYDYLNGQLIEKLGAIPPYSLIGIDVGGVVDTIQFNKAQKRYNRNEKNLFSEAYTLLKKGIRNKDLSLICRASTISARINQSILPKPNFEVFEKFAEQYGGGVVIAHSGTMVGMIFDSSQKDINDLSSRFSKMFPAKTIEKTIKPSFFGKEIYEVHNQK